MIIIAIFLCIIKHLFSHYENSELFYTLSAWNVLFHSFFVNHLTRVLCREHVGGLRALVQSAMVLLTEVMREMRSFNVITGSLELYLPFVLVMYLFLLISLYFLILSQINNSL